MKLIIGNKLYSSWSLRPWLVMKAFKIPFEEIVLPLRTQEFSEKIGLYSPTGKVPVLIDGDVTVWDSLAIIDYLNDSFPECGIWPKDIHAVGFARSMAAEMHAGFTSLRKECPMNLGKRYAPQELSEATQADVARIAALWREARERFGKSGPFLMGRFSAADAMFAPVATRFLTYSITLGCETAKAYGETLLNFAPFRDWREAALHEPWTNPTSEFDYDVIHDFRKSSEQ
jgi:glutathione S-transferase